MLSGADELALVAGVMHMARCTKVYETQITKLWEANVSMGRILKEQGEREEKMLALLQEICST